MILNVLEEKKWVCKLLSESNHSFMELLKLTCDSLKTYIYFRDTFVCLWKQRKLRDYSPLKENNFCPISRTFAS